MVLAVLVKTKVASSNNAGLPLQEVSLQRVQHVESGRLRVLAA